MISLKLCRTTLIRLFVALAIISSLLVPPGYSQETEDSQVFMSGFNAYQQKNYTTAIKKMNEVLQKYPDSPLRDMAIFWLARSFYKNGNLQDAARYMSQFSKEYPDNPLRGTVEDELLALTAKYEQGEKLAAGPTAAEQAAQEQQAKLQAEKEQQAKAKAEQERLAAEKAEQDRAAQLKAAQVKRAAEQAAQQKREAEQAAQEQQAREKAENERLARAKADQERLAAEKAEQERLAQLKAAQEKTPAEQAAQAQLAMQQVEKENQARAKAELERLAAEKAEQDRQAQLKAAQEKQAAEQAAQAQLARQQAEKEQLAKTELVQPIPVQPAEPTAQAQLAKELDVKAQQAKAEQDRTAAEQVEQERLAQLKATQEKQAAEQAAQAQLAKQRAEKEQQARAEQERLAKAKAEQDRIAAEKAEQERLAQLKANQERQAAEQAESMRIAREKAEQKRKETELAEQQRLAQAKTAQEKAAQEQAAADQAAQEKLARQQAEQAEQERLARARAKLDRIAAEKAEQERLGQQKAAQEQAASKRADEERVSAERAVLREKAIAQYKSIIENYPGSKAATTAAAKLKDMGIAMALPPQIAAVERQESGNAQVLKFEVAQYAGFEFNLTAPSKAYEVARRINVPFELTNRGNGTDSFMLDSSFPAEFKATFAAADAPDKTIRQTPSLAPGEIFKGVVSLEIPAASIDGLKVAYPVKAASAFMAEATQSREIAMTASAPLLRAVLKMDKTHLLPGEKVLYRVALLNIGSMTASDVAFRLNFPQQLEPVDLVTAGMKQEMATANTTMRPVPVLVAEGLQIKSGETREFNVTFQLKDDSLAGQQLFARADLDNSQLKTRASFISNAALVDPQHGIKVRTAATAERLVVIPGQTATVPIVVTNTGNVNERFKIATSLKTAPGATFFLDTNRDGIRQNDEPVITELGPLAPKEEASIVMEIKTPRSIGDRTEDNALVTFTPEGDAPRAATATAHLVYSRPELKMVIAARDGRLKPGEVTTFDLNLTNNGSNIARVVELQSAWPEQLELVSAEPANSSNTNGTILWRFKEVGAGEKKTIKVSFRVKLGTSVGTNIQVKNILTYEDQLGNRY